MSPVSVVVTAYSIAIAILQLDIALYRHALNNQKCSAFLCLCEIDGYILSFEDALWLVKWRDSECRFCAYVLVPLVLLNQKYT